MNRDKEQRQAEELDAFIATQLSGAEGPEDESRDEARAASHLIELARSTEVRSKFASRLEAQIYQAARHKRAAAIEHRVVRRSILPHISSSRKGWQWAAVPLIAAGVVAAFLFFLLAQPAAVDARQIFDKAKNTVVSQAAGAVHSFHLTENSTLLTTSGETIHTSATRWFQAPDHWRVELDSTVTGANGKEVPGRASRSVSVTDGTTVWYFDRQANSVTINPVPGGPTGATNVTDFGQQPDSINALFGQASSCFDPRLSGADTIAGRPVYILDLGVMKCAGNVTEGSSTIWVDKETFFVLKHVQDGADGSTALATTQITAIEYNPTVDAGLFSLTPPPGSVVQDFRPKPAPSAAQFKEQLEALANKSAFPLFAPDYVPAGLAPRVPRSGSDGGIQLEFLPPEQVDKPSAAILSGLLINQQRATYDLVVKWTEGARPVQISNGEAWLRSDAPNPVGGGADRAAYVLRDGTLVSIASFQADSDELLKVAGALRTVAGSHAPLPNPNPPVLAALRGKVSFPVFVPTEIPAGLVAEPPLGGDSPSASIEINYHAADGSIALTVVNGPPDCCAELEAVQGEDVKLPDGTLAHIILDPGEGGGWLLWWETQGALIKISGPDLTRSDLITIASSMDRNAELGPMEAVPARPALAPLPAPRFVILEPTWLPESMTKQQDFQKGPAEIGSWVALSFMPKAANQPRTPLILLEKPLTLVKGHASELQATRVKIGRYEVTVTRTALECSNYDWQVGELHLSLANSFNESGTARYSCEQMAKMVESIR
ncbi:MAG: LolA family protein [Rudaea sp.]